MFFGPRTYSAAVQKLDALSLTCLQSSSCCGLFRFAEPLRCLPIADWTLAAARAPPPFIERSSGANRSRRELV